jgi:hypothetical protein
MTEKQFKAWLKVKLGNLAGVCDAGYQKPERLLSRLSDIFSEAEKRALTVTKKKAAQQQ